MITNTPLVNVLNTALSLGLFALGFLCLLTQRNVVKQVVGLRIMLQGVTMGLIHNGLIHGDNSEAQAMAVSALVVEAIVIAVSLALIANIYRHYPSGDIDDLDRLRG
jgi:NADH:ubiquinone oxidoreductase subunit K